MVEDSWNILANHLNSSWIDGPLFDDDPCLGNDANRKRNNFGRRNSSDSDLF